ncbi:hypothetical protein E2C01_052163 [Portunus trituberculatus]|uniref:Uncharacterized protein n=1 Tax=Portunus trituberculatus TaxID=210409 RepID=A0A5B7GMA6_PORTR|nr:hypothetical protein [Portunus trituberculatus]
MKDGSAGEGDSLGKRHTIQVTGRRPGPPSNYPASSPCILLDALRRLGNGGKKQNKIHKERLTICRVLERSPVWQVAVPHVSLASRSA